MCAYEKEDEPVRQPPAPQILHCPNCDEETLRYNNWTHRWECPCGYTEDIK